MLYRFARGRLKRGVALQDQAEIEAAQLVRNEEVVHHRAANSELREGVRLPRQFLDFKAAITSSKCKCEENPNYGYPRLRGLIPRKRGEECRMFG